LQWETFDGVGGASVSSDLRSCRRIVVASFDGRVVDAPAWETFDE
jgi:hypothetical protein